MWNKCRAPGGPCQLQTWVTIRAGSQTPLNFATIYLVFVGPQTTHQLRFRTFAFLVGLVMSLSWWIHVCSHPSGLAFQLDGYRQGTAQTCRLGAGLCAPFPHPSTPQAPQGSCIHTNRNRPKTPICCGKAKEKLPIYHSYFQNQINVRWSCIK